MLKVTIAMLIEKAQFLRDIDNDLVIREGMFEGHNVLNLIENLEMPCQLIQPQAYPHHSFLHMEPASLSTAPNRILSVRLPPEKEKEVFGSEKSSS